jgi:formylglycine-generating enzyme required for sulfatase activity
VQDKDAAAEMQTADGSLHPGELMTRTVSGIDINFRYVPAGSFQRDENPENISIITKGYWMGETEGTQELFEAVMGTNPSQFQGSSYPPAAGETQVKRPVERVNWYAAITFCNKLSLLDGKEPVYSVSEVNDWANLAYSDIPTSDNSTWDAATQDLSKNGYRLPTEMEWMWAAMGADKTAQSNTRRDRGFSGRRNGENSIDDCVWYGGNSGEVTHEVAKKTANELGIYDMSGNVEEWCWDWASWNLHGKVTDYVGPASSVGQTPMRVRLGGSWGTNAREREELRNSDYASLNIDRVDGWPPSEIREFFGIRLVCSQ